MHISYIFFSYKQCNLISVIWTLNANDQVNTLHLNSFKCIICNTCS